MNFWNFTIPLLFSGTLFLTGFLRRLKNQQTGNLWNDVNRFHFVEKLKHYIWPFSSKLHILKVNSKKHSIKPVKTFHPCALGFLALISGSRVERVAYPSFLCIIKRLEKSENLWTRKDIWGNSSWCQWISNQCELPRVSDLSATLIWNFGRQGDGLLLEFTITLNSAMYSQISLDIFNQFHLSLLNLRLYFR